VYAVPTQCSHDSGSSFAASTHNKTTSGVSRHCPINLTSTDSTRGLLPIPLHVGPDDTIVPGVPSVANDETIRTGLPFNSLPNGPEHLPTVTTSGANRAAPIVHPWPTMPPEVINLTRRDISPAKTDPKTKPVEQKTFDHRPPIYMGQKLEFNVGIEDLERERSLTELWGNASYFRYIDGKGQGGQPAPTGTNKWEVLQKFGVGKLNATDDNHDNLEFVMRVFNATSDTLDWYLRHLEVVNSKEWDGFHATDWNKHDPIDHYNWISKAHGILGSMNLAQQREINSLIDNIDKLNTGDLIKLYNMFEVREDMLWEHKLQVAEFFQIASLKFPEHDEPNTLSSIRGPIHLVDWNDPTHPRTKATRPIDGLARYWIPATDFNHNDLTTLTLIKIAHEIIDVQRKFREQVRTLTSAPPTPRN
jgi:hypothetical protein